MVLARSLSWRSTAYWIAIPLLAVSALAAMIIAWESSRTRIRFEGTRLAVLLIPAGFGLLSFLAILWLDASRVAPGPSTTVDVRVMPGPIPGGAAGRFDLPQLPTQELSVDQAWSIVEYLCGEEAPTREKPPSSRS